MMPGPVPVHGDGLTVSDLISWGHVTMCHSNFAAPIICLSTTINMSLFVRTEGFLRSSLSIHSFLLTKRHWLVRLVILVGYGHDPDPHSPCSPDVLFAHSDSDSLFTPTRIFFIHNKYFRTCSFTGISLFFPSLHLPFPLFCLHHFGTGTEIYLSPGFPDKWNSYPRVRSDPTIDAHDRDRRPVLSQLTIPANNNPGSSSLSNHGSSPNLSPFDSGHVSSATSVSPQSSTPDGPPPPGAHLHGPPPALE
jgi:hypothetical protein